MYSEKAISLIDDDTEKMNAVTLTKADEDRIKRNSIKGKVPIPSVDAPVIAQTDEKPSIATAETVVNAPATSATSAPAPTPPVAAQA